MHRRAALAALLAASLAAPSAVAQPPVLVSGTGTFQVAEDGLLASHELPAALAVHRLAPTRDGWVAAGVGAGERLVVIASSAGALRVLDAPAPAGRATADPTPVVADGRLAGLAWLGGEDRESLGVRYAPYDGAAWGSAETVAAPGATRLALAAARLGDGSLLLAWAGDDGEDDEIFWSRRTEGDRASPWSAPERLAGDDRVPDVTPALAAVPGGALAAWTAFDADAGATGAYRTVVARFEVGSGAWSRPSAIGPAGALYPELTDSGIGPLVTLRDAAAGAWAVLALELVGDARPGLGTPPAVRVTHRARVAGAPGERPVVAGADAEGLEIVAPGSSGPPGTRNKRGQVGAARGPATTVTVAWEESP